MNCKCGKKMKLIFVWDDSQLTDHAYNIYACQDCGRIMKEDVWEDKGEIWIGLSGIEE